MVLYYRNKSQIKLLSISEVAIDADATKIDAYKKSQLKKKLKSGVISTNLKGKNYTDGNQSELLDYKLHILCDSKFELPLT